MLQGSWSGPTRLDLALRTRFTVTGGYLRLEDTGRDKPYARWLDEAAWVWARKPNKVVFGVSVVLLVWTDGQVRIPLAFRGWHTGGASKGALALALLSSARQRRRCQPPCVRFDSWSPAKKLRQRRRDDGGYFVCQLKKNRRCAGRPLACSLWQPYWHATGWLSGERKVLVVRDRRQYYATKRLSLSAKEVRAHYTQRQAVEEVFRPLTSSLSLEACQAGYRRSRMDTPQPSEGAQAHQVARCLVASLIVERERLDRGLTWMRLKRHLILTGASEALPALERVRHVA
jgi:hypothetical protein